MFRGGLPTSSAPAAPTAVKTVVMPSGYGAAPTYGAAPAPGSQVLPDPTPIQFAADPRNFAGRAPAPMAPTPVYAAAAAPPVPPSVAAMSAHQVSNASVIKENDHNRILLVAKAVAGSVHRAKFQKELMDRQKHNPNFAFLVDQHHPQHAFYKHAIESFMQDREKQIQQEQQMLMRERALAAQRAIQQQKEIEAARNAASEAETRKRPREDGDGFQIVLPGGAGGSGSGAADAQRVPIDDDDDDDDGPQWEFIIENGIQRAVPVTKKPRV